MKGSTMSSVCEPIALTRASIPAASEMFARTFHNDPRISHLLPDSAKRRRLSARSFQCLLRYGVHCGEVLATSANLEGVAIWLPPEAAHGSLAKDTMNGDNVAFYERFGFSVAAKSVVPKTEIGLWLMARGD
jgi:hypothetical protein